MEPSYWRDRLVCLEGQARRLRVTERTNLAPAELKVLDLDLTSYDMRQIRAMVVYDVRAMPPSRVQIHWRLNPSLNMTAFRPAGPGAAQLHIFRDPSLRLEERVLDFLALVSVMHDLPCLAGSTPLVELAEGQALNDEYRIGRALVKRGWCEALKPERVKIEYR